MNNNRLMAEVAAHLARRSVLLRGRPSFLKGFDGVAHQTREGLAVVDIRPGMADEVTLKLFAHEIAHVALGQDLTFTTEYPPESMEYTDFGMASYKSNPDERAADDKADEWLAYADNQAGLYERRGYGWLESRLLALKAWPLDVQGIVDNAVKQAVKNYKRS